MWPCKHFHLTCYHIYFHGVTTHVVTVVNWEFYISNETTAKLVWCKNCIQLSKNVEEHNYLLKTPLKSMYLIKGTVQHKSNGIVECKMRSLEECYSWFCHVWCVGDLHMAGSTSRDSGLKETVTLKWCTPRTNSVGEWNSGRSFLVSFIWQIFDVFFIFVFLQNCITAQGPIAFLL